MSTVNRVLVVAAVAVALVSGCSEDGRRESLHTVEPAGAVPAPAVTQPPAGTVDTSLRAVSNMIFDTATEQLVTIAGGKAVVGGLTIDDARGLAAGRPGEVLVAAGTGVDRVDVASERVVEHVDAGADTLSAALLPDDRLAVGTATGHVLVFDGDTVTSRTSGFASVDALAQIAGSLFALDIRQSMLVEVNVEDGRHGLALRTGQGAAKLATDHWGRILVTDPRTKELTVFGSDPLMMRQRIPTIAAPFAIAYDDKREIAWVTLTETNEVVGYDLSTGTAVEVRRHPTVRQPNAIAIDPDSGAIFVAGDEGMQQIPA